MPIYRFLCPDGHETEVIVPMGTEQITCAHALNEPDDVTDDVLCGEIATKQVQTSVARPQGGPTPIHYPGRGIK